MRNKIIIKIEREKKFYSLIKNTVSKLDDEYIPRRSLLEFIKDKYPFDLEQLIGKTNIEAGGFIKPYRCV